MVMSALDRCKHFGVANIRGLAYMPGPSNYTKSVPPQTLYETSDFYNNIFERLWSRDPLGRNDLQRYQTKLGINFIHCYDWAAPVTQKVDGSDQDFLTHRYFIETCNDCAMKVTVPISNYTMQLLSEGKDQEARVNVEKVLEEVYIHSAPYSLRPGVGMWKIFNEYELSWDRNPKHVVTVMTWIAEWEAKRGIFDALALPVMVCTSFGMSDGIEGAGYLKQVRDILMKSDKIGPYTAEEFWRGRIVFATNPQNDGPDIADYLARRLPKYWQDRNIPAPPVMFTELGSSKEQSGSEEEQAARMKRQIDASRPGSSNGLMLGACVFLNEERPWEAGWEKTFGITRFGQDPEWGRPKANYPMETKFPVWDPKGWYWLKDGEYPVEQQQPKANYHSVAAAWKPKG